MPDHCLPTENRINELAAASPQLDPAQPSKAIPAPATRAEVVPFFEQVWQYQLDCWQRSVLFLDMMRERANNMLEHEAANMPAPLDFDFEPILDARDFERPANYALLRITRCRTDRVEDCLDETKPPVIIIDPRAGHGPGIGGFKRESEVGMSLHEGHPTYFVVFFPLPSAQQTLADVLHALRRFVEEVVRRHPGKAPILYGNCQAGWAATILAADCEGLSGTTVLNGSPLSYWAGASNINPMRLSGGLLGGLWLTRWLADLGNGHLDGAWLVQNFESLNPAHTLWDKNYDVYAHIDTERERFLSFERWWTGFYFLAREEILSIVGSLFIGNQLERGLLRICDCCVVDLTRIHNPIVIFASSGDNITPPHQALNWIPAVYPTTAELKLAKQRIVYLLNTHVGHLGIFVSASVARLEHRAILESLDQIEALPPGLYEMKISNPTGDPDCRKPQYSVRFEEREVDQIHYDYPKHAFQKVQAVSEWNDYCYKTMGSPIVRALANPMSAQLLKWSHPMRVSRAVFSERFNPWMLPFALLAPAIASWRRMPADGNAFTALERAGSAAISGALDSWRQWRDSASEHVFSAIYGRD